MLEQTGRQNRAGQTVLADGTPLDLLIDRERREVGVRLLTDPEIYELELARIFARNWIVLGHESEIPQAGDFVTRKMGDDFVILVRRRDGSIECLLNACPHRGAIVCREEAGNNALFRCIYHGWTFNTDGSFRGAPFRNEMYPEGLDVDRLGLPRARVGTHCGIIFANWDESAPPLEEFLGDYRYYLDMMFGLTPEGMEVIGPPQRFIMKANWKTASEQAAGDAYHAGQLHRCIQPLTGGDPNDSRDWQLHAPKVSVGKGHSVLCFDPEWIFRALSGGRELSVQEKLAMLPPAGVPHDQVPAMLDHLSEMDQAFLATTPPAAACIFPNVGVICMVDPAPQGPPRPFLSFRTWVPYGPDKLEFCMWVLVAKGASQDYRSAVLGSTSFMRGASGVIEIDDAVIWPEQTASARGYVARQKTLKYMAVSGDSPSPGWPGGGQVHEGFSRDDTQWHWWQAYFDEMGRPA